jgi:imidazolonepropionase-like amidohydrolase
MKTRVLAVVAGLGWAAALSAGAEEAPKVTVLKAARLFDGQSGTLVAPAVVVVEGTKIKSVGTVLPDPSAETLDLGDVTLVPGFIDAHVHLSGELGDNWYQATLDDMRRTVAEQAIRSTDYARKTLMAGFTTVRNLGAADYIDIGLRNAIAAGVVVGPRMLVSGYPLGARGGHCDATGFPYNFFGREPGIA